MLFGQGFDSPHLHKFSPNGAKGCSQWRKPLVKIATNTISPKGAKPPSIRMPQSFSSNHFHIVFSTKDRVNFISNDIKEKLYGYIGGIIRNSIGTLIIAGGTSDHIHLLLEIK